jgi:fucose permease
MTLERKTDAITIGLTYLGFIGLGLATGLLGIAWPSMRADFQQPLDAMGLLLLMGTVGYLIASFYSGQIMTRLGAGLMFAVASALTVIGFVAYVIAPSWAVMILAALIVSFGTGAIDAGTNAYVAAHHSPRTMNWLHACFGIGITIGPFMMTEILKQDLSWRLGYVVVGVVHVLLTLGFALTLKYWRIGFPQATTSAKPVQAASLRQSLAVPAVWLSVFLFVVYTGLEGTPGAWAYTLFTEGRGIAEATAGLWASLYWGSFTVGRIFFGAIINYVSMTWLVRLCMAGSVAGIILLWANPFPTAGMWGLIVFGFSQAPLFPILISTTAQRVGPAHTPNTIGFQLAGAGIGLAAIPGFVGILARNISLEIIGPFLFVAALLVMVVYEISLARGVQPETVPQPAAGD